MVLMDNLGLLGGVKLNFKMKRSTTKNIDRLDGSTVHLLFLFTADVIEIKQSITHRM